MLSASKKIRSIHKEWWYLPTSTLQRIRNPTLSICYDKDLKLGGCQGKFRWVKTKVFFSKNNFYRGEQTLNLSKDISYDANRTVPMADADRKGSMIFSPMRLMPPARCSTQNRGDQWCNIPYIAIILSMSIKHYPMRSQHTIFNTSCTVLYPKQRVINGIIFSSIQPMDSIQLPHGQ